MYVFYILARFFSIFVVWNRVSLMSEHSWSLAHQKHYKPFKIPIHDISYAVNGTNSDRSVFVVPRRAYSYTRLLHGKPRNIIVIISEVHDDALKSIIGCELNGKITKSMNILKEQSFTSWVRKHRRGYTPNSSCGMFRISC